MQMVGLVEDKDSSLFLGLDEVPTSAQVQHIDREHSHIITDFLDRLHSLHQAWGSALPEAIEERHPSFHVPTIPVSHRLLSYTLCSLQSLSPLQLELSVLSNSSPGLSNKIAILVICSLDFSTRQTVTSMQVKASGGQNEY